ncbi:MAG: glycosyltransferase family 9 protein [Betaproteobacteria bacterium]|nr:glycosyltransferase family 9 protein [Betaproteobacteria bacterium]
MKILVIRRDNIGDLVCTTPLLRALREHFPRAWIGALANTYNAPVLSGNADVDEVFAYRKAKHRDAGESILAAWWQTWKLIRRLREESLDLAIVAATGRQPAALKFARWVRARRVIAYGEPADGIDDPLPPAEGRHGHETEAVMRLLRPLGIDEAPGPVRVFADPVLVEKLKHDLAPAGGGPLVGLHISARKPSQRWPVERFAALAHALHASGAARFLLFWSPGAEEHPQHPGDDGKAEKLATLCRGLPFAACPSKRLEDLIAGLAPCDCAILADGGAMHIAAGLGKPIVCLFGDSGAERWHPWGVPHRLLQAPSRQVADIPIEAVVQAYTALLASR